MSTLINEFCSIINLNNEIKGDILEFGTGSAHSGEIICSNVKNKKFFTFDGFIGLPKTEKGVPTNTCWEEGNLKFSYENAVQKLSKFDNVKIFKTMSWDLTKPEDYGIDKICAVNLDFDLYEGTIDALKFIQKADWKKIVVRFDDWGAYDYQVKEEVDAHEKAAFYDWIKETSYSFEELTDLTKLSKGLQSIFFVTR